MKPESNKTSTNRRSKRGCLLLLVAAASLSGCARSKSEAEMPEDVSEFFAPTDVGTLRAESLRRKDAIKSCVNNAGFPYIKGPDGSLTLPQRRTPSDFLRYRFDSPAAKQFGYGSTVEIVFSRAGLAYIEAEERKQISTQEIFSYQKAISECSTKVDSEQRQRTRKKLTASDVSERIEKRFTDFFARIAADPEVSTAIREWSKCMTSKGFSGQTPQEVRETFQERAIEFKLEPIAESESFDSFWNRQLQSPDFQKLQGAEVETARADSACQELHLSPVDDEIRSIQREIFGIGPSQA